MKITRYFLVNDIWNDPEENLDDRHASIPRKYPKAVADEIIEQEWRDGVKRKDTIKCINSGLYTIGIATYDIEFSEYYPDCWFEIH